MKIFSIEEANALLPTARRIVEAARREHARLIVSQEAAKAAAACSQFGGGMPGGGRYVEALVGLAEHSGKLETLGVQMKDYSRGLIDFPSMREGRVVLLCWQLGEGDTIEWWHDLETGFAGRRPL